MFEYNTDKSKKPKIYLLSWNLTKRTLKIMKASEISYFTSIHQSQMDILIKI